jgi:hypothetical protein
MVNAKNPLATFCGDLLEGLNHIIVGSGFIRARTCGSLPGHDQASVLIALRNLFYLHRISGCSIKCFRAEITANQDKRASIGHSTAHDYLILDCPVAGIILKPNDR